MPSSARAIVRDVLSRRMADDIWSENYDKVLPVSFNDFELSAVLPAVFYMFRFGHRRGKGEFLNTFGPEGGTPRERRQKTTVNRVAEKLAACRDFEGFDAEVGQAILGDLLLGFSLENIKHGLGRDKQIQRVAPAHYMASWIDLPDRSVNLRYVPEMIVAMLADQEGKHVKPSHGETRTWFPVARARGQNLLLEAFNPGIEQVGAIDVDNRAADKFNESEENIGVDQLLMIRLAQQLRAAPDKIRGRESRSISNQRPIAKQAAQDFSEDIHRFVRAYAGVIPRHAFVDMLEACIATGMTTILASVVEILLEWTESGKITEKKDQKPPGIFVDCSGGVDRRLRDLAERSFDDLMRRIERVPATLMMLRLLDYAARSNRCIRNQQIPTCPYATEWLNLLGDLLHEHHDEADHIHRRMDEHSEELADALREDHPEAAEALRNEQGERNPIRRLALALTPLLRQARLHTINMVDSTLNIERPNGLARKRITTSGAQAAGGRGRRRAVRSLVFTDSVLDYLVHLHLLPSGNKPGVRPLSLKGFLKKIRDRYGFHVDAEPPGMRISNDLLRLNRTVVERRLRDLGLLVGVNDAEAMKRLQARFDPKARG